MRALVSHSGIQHAHQLAWALEQSGHLLALWSGVPVRDSARPAPSSMSPLARLRAIPVPRSRRRHAVVFPALQRLASRFLAPRLASRVLHRVDHAYDRWIAWRVGGLRPDVVIGYENSSLHTFRAAKRWGAMCVLDAASIHYRFAADWIGVPGQADPDWINRFKQQEIELADAVLTCSELAAETYVRAGVPAQRVHCIPLGTELPEVRAVQRDPGGDCRFVFVGSLMQRKAVDLLLDVFERLGAEGAPARLALIGGVMDAGLLRRARAMANVSHAAFIPQPALFDEIARHDCLVLPSRFDAFGMVVAEAMACGVPAIVSQRVGAKSIIEQHPGAGWVVSGDVEALYCCIRQRIDDRDGLARAGVAARAAAQDHSWQAYRSRVVATLEQLHASFVAGHN